METPWRKSHLNDQSVKAFYMPVMGIPGFRRLSLCKMFIVIPSFLRLGML